MLPAAVLWDMDGTLVDTEPYWFAAERDLVDRFGHGIWPDEIAHGMVGFDLMDGAAYLQHHGGVDLPAAEIVDRLLDGVIARLMRNIPWRPGARELLADLKAAGVPCALVTMSWRRFADPVLAALPDRSFVATITGDEVPPGEGKPGPVPYLLGAEACGARPEDCVAIEDSPTGVRSALAAGCQVLGIPNVKALTPEPGLTVVDSLEPVRVEHLSRLFDTPIPAARAPIVWPKWLPLAAIATAVALVAAFALMRSGGDDGPPPLPPGAVPIDVWVPYWTLDVALPELDDKIDEIREISPFWYGARGITAIVVDENAPADRLATFTERARDARGAVLPSVRDELPGGEMAAIFADETTRERHVDALLAFAEDQDVDGLDIDYEQFAFADGSDTWEATRPNWVAFVESLATQLHDDGRTLTVSIPGVWDVTETGSSGYWVYDHGAIAPFVDAIRIMAYDYSGSAAGPVSPLGWVSDVLAGVSAVVPEEFHDKLVLGVPSYGTNTVESTLGSCPASAEGRTNVTARSALDLAERRGGLPSYDEVAGEWTFTYALTVEDAATSCVQNRKVWWVDSEGVAARVELARRAGWGGVALWALGYEDAEVWTAFITASRVTLAAAEE